MNTILGMRNLVRADNDAKLGKLATPEPQLTVNPLEGHDVALYVDGKRVSISYLAVESIERSGISIVMETALAACLDPNVEAVQALAWGGFTPLQTVNYQAGERVPSGGVFQIESVRLPVETGGAAYFIGKALTDLYDWSDDGRRIAAAGDACEILTTHVRKQP
jgi:hypothetical protein